MGTERISAGFLPLYLKLYEDLSPGNYRKADPFIDDIGNLIRASGVRPVSPGVVFDTCHVEDAERLFKEEDVSFIVLLHLCYSPSLLLADFLEKTGLPVLVIDSTPDPSFENMRSDYMTRNHGIHGVMDLTSVLKSRGIEYSVVAGHREDPLFRRNLEKNLSALSAVSIFKKQKIGITGKPFIGMGDFSIDFGQLKNDFGIEVEDIPVEMIITENGSIEDSEIEKCIAEDGEFWDTAIVPEEVHVDSVRTYLALKKIFKRKEITGYTMNFQYITESISTPFYACSRIMSEGYGYGGEGDVLTATLGYPLNAISPAAKFDEFFCADWKNDLILMSHMGESDSRFVKKGSAPSLVVRDGFVNPRDSVVYRFQAEPGEVTFVNISPVRGGGFRMVSGLLDIIDAPVLEEIAAPHYQVKTRVPVNDFLETYALAGGGHHLYIAKGNILGELAVFCRFLGFELIII